MVNARISDRSFPRYRRLRRMLRGMVTNVDIFLAQSEEDCKRLIAIGAPEDRIKVTGNMKFDAGAGTEAQFVGALRRALEDGGAGPVIICGSTVEGEEALLIPAIQAVRQRHPKAMLILAPRHPERFAAVAELLASAGLRYWLRSRWDGSSSLRGGVFLLDSIGELASLYSVAQIAFVGGSLVPRGGHNIIEPARAGTAILVGPHTENFRDIVSIFRRAGAIRVVGAGDLPHVLLDLLANEAERWELARRARQVVEAQLGATDRTVRVLKTLVCAPGEPARPGSLRAFNQAK